MFPTLQTVVRSSFSRDDGLHASGCSPTLLSAKSTATFNRTLSDLTAAFSGNQVLDTFRRGGAQLFELLQSKAGSEMNPHDQSHPFGYEFHENFADSATAVVPPSSAEPLLNLQEHNFLANFWNNPSQHTNPNDFSTLGHLNSANDSNGYSWQMLMNEPPPTVRDIAAASVPQSNVSQQHAHGLSPHLGLSENPLNLHANGIVDSNALMSQSQQSHNSLRQMSNGSTMSPAFHIPRTQTQSVQPQRVYQSPGLQNVSGASAQASIIPSTLKMEAVHTHDALIGITSATEIDNLRAVAHSNMLSALPPIQTTTIPTMTFAVPHSAPVADRLDQSANPRLYHFGSDNNFNAGGFQPSSDFERHEYRAELLSSELRRLKPINRTPIGTREHSPESTSITKRQNVVEQEISNGNPNNAIENGHKRKRSHDSVASDSDTDDIKNQSNSAKKQRRSSGTASSRPKRENLSEVQKRQNHIASEQKRRAQIKLGFDELNRLVPEIRDSGLSKSGMLMEACNFLEQLQAQNSKLAQRLNVPMTTE